MLDDRKAQPGTTHFAASRPINPVEPLEKPRQVRSGYPNAVIRDTDCQFFTGQSRRYGHLASRITEFYGVIDQVDHRLFKKRRIDTSLKGDITLTIDIDFFGSRLWFTDGHRTVEDFFQRNILKLNVGAAGLLKA